MVLREYNGAEELKIGDKVYFPAPVVTLYDAKGRGSPKISKGSVNLLVSPVTGDNASSSPKRDPDDKVEKAVRGGNLKNVTNAELTEWLRLSGERGYSGLNKNALFDRVREVLQRKSLSTQENKTPSPAVS